MTIECFGCGAQIEEEKAKDADWKYGSFTPDACWLCPDCQDGPEYLDGFPIVVLGD